MHLPSSRGLFDQPARTMEFIAIVQDVFSQRLRDEYKKGGK